MLKKGSLFTLIYEYGETNFYASYRPDDYKTHPTIPDRSLVVYLGKRIGFVYLLFGDKLGYVAMEHIRLTPFRGDECRKDEEGDLDSIKLW